ncbi:DUF2637 domain-containing protein [Streptomyces sp. SL13]|uniref:DUF2637 domain-containing protein n=1 Tax=Streptantibioticus silvisoli TaxID=2705255 RepID=A0AA90HB06_9ACTN|nr:DUF2637 domain-containing protein [Streptantibioticus silvisoli]MDI5971422.1 DUF2637 domain-containing protein [Streptantibioticus silvisoli]
MLTNTNTEQVQSAERVLSAGTWAITAGAVLYSVLTVTPLMRAHTPAGWAWTAPILPLVVDAAVVIVVRLDSTLARLGGKGGPWAVVLRWLTGVFTLALNVGTSALSGDMVGVAVHMVAPALLIVTSEASLAYRRAIASALARIDREHRVHADQERVQREAREKADREEREATRRAREAAEREARETAAALAREEREAAAAERAATREHEARMERERADRASAAAREQAAREQARLEAEQREREQAREQEQAERERREQQARDTAERHAAERAEAEQKAAERAERERAEAVRERQAREAEWEALRATGGKLPEDDAVTAVAMGVLLGKTVRQIADDTGWSVGWVAKQLREHHSDTNPERPHLVAAERDDDLAQVS